MKKQFYIPCALLMTAVILCLGVLPSYASTYTDLQNAQSELEATESEIESTQESIKDINSVRTSLQLVLDELNEQLRQASGELSDLEVLIETKEEKIATAQAELEEAIIKEAEQYEAMKKRIQFMYEKGDTMYLQLFLECKNFGDFLNKSEYVSQLTTYDRQMLEEYASIQEKIAKNEQILQDEKAALSALVEEAEEKQEETVTLVEEAAASMATYLESVSELEQSLMELETQLKEEQNDVATLQAQLEEETKLTQAAALSGFTDISDIVFSSGDIDLMAAIIECEAGGESYTGKVAVGNVVMNRVKSSVFPNTVLEVIYQSGQFSPVASGRFAVVLARGANESCYEAAAEAMAGATPVGNCLFFRTPIEGLTGIQIGGHIFY